MNKAFIVGVNRKKEPADYVWVEITLVRFCIVFRCLCAQPQISVRG